MLISMWDVRVPRTNNYTFSKTMFSKPLVLFYKKKQKQNKTMINFCYWGLVDRDKLICVHD